MTKTYIIQRGKRFVVIVTHPEATTWEVSCPTRERAEEVAYYASVGRYTGC